MVLARYQRQGAKRERQAASRRCFFHPASPHFVYHNLFMGGKVELVEVMDGERLVDEEASACPCIASRFPNGRCWSIGRQQRKAYQMRAWPNANPARMAPPRTGTVKHVISNAISGAEDLKW